MKKILLLLASSLLTAQQTSELLSNNWYISKMVTSGGQTTNTPVIDNGVPATTFNSAGGTSYVINSRYYNISMMSFGVIPGGNNLIKTASSCTLLFYNGGNAAPVRAYDQKNCDAYVLGAYGSIYSYQITNNGNIKTLTITDPSGNKIYYNNTPQLSTKEVQAAAKTFKAYPNPVKEVLHLENIERNLPLKIYDLSGKLVFETTTHSDKTSIDTSSLQKGQYMITIENYKSYPFVKE
ncbi:MULTISPECIES: T9SS type A sorting domain-containing protein [unclassified Chryseobacterium]|uniref:T9SS type A sorting domain-containing protein n=1 Tax=unclassified Chryseobacterium TaxID=2593645 RepID=UPI0028536891|nr:T9SS type A sorting domain-containing protein [Chryseobacterium sp. CFS7]MDR4892456.1 T9SS type A sorting domain-containing protein [Chryseobacterium sp. CFS7]